MKAIGFKNFRKFEEFPTLELGGITYLVGGNNAGKSTVVKAMRLLLANLKSLQTIGTGMLNRKPVFYFDYPKDIHIGTFVKALRHGAERKSITIQGELAPLNIKLKISQVDELAAYGMIDNIQLKNDKEGYLLTFDVMGNKAYLDKNGEILTQFNDTKDSMSSPLASLMEQASMLSKRQTNLRDQISSYESSIVQIKNSLSLLRSKFANFSKYRGYLVAMPEGYSWTAWRIPDDDPISFASKEYDSKEDLDKAKQVTAEKIEELKLQLKTLQETTDITKTQLNECIMQLADVNSKMNAVKSAKTAIKPTQKVEPADNTIAVPLSMSINYEGENVICQYINGMIMTLSTDKRSANPSAVQLLKQIREQFEEVLRGNSIEYVPAHAATQQTIFRISDENDNMAQLVHAWSRQQINPGDEEHQFIIRWMKSLGIGENFKVRPMEGEAYAVDIYEHNSDTTPATLSELGMGAIQAMTLLFRLSSIMRQYKEQKNKPMILIEEPEQNMHPSWQSHLADIFEGMRSLGFRLLVETHSEYLIRKSQLQVAAMKFVDQADLDENCPISTWYFPDKEAPYAMQYAIQGNFYKPFGTGFFDEADNLATRLML